MHRILLTCMVILTSGVASGQKIKVVSGDLNALNGITTLKIEYDYSDLGVGKYEVEQEYIAKKVTEMNEDEAGTGDSWKVKWFEDRPDRYEPKFEELFSKYAPVIKSGKDVESDMIMKVHTVFIEPGYNVGVSRKPAYIDLEVTFFRAGEVLAVVSLLNSPGADAWGLDFDTGYRISEAYAKAGKSLAGYLLKYLR